MAPPKTDWTVPIAHLCRTHCHCLGLGCCLLQLQAKNVLELGVREGVSTLPLLLGASLTGGRCAPTSAYTSDVNVRAVWRSGASLSSCPQPRLCRKKAAARALTGAQQCTIRSICSRAGTREYGTPEYLLCLRQYYDAAYVCAAASLKLVTSRKLRVPPHRPSGLRTVGALAAVLAVLSQ